jgi:hypothetical protein
MKTTLYILTILLTEQILKIEGLDIYKLFIMATPYFISEYQ